jgi:hypothetical protein
VLSSPRGPALAVLSDDDAKLHAGASVTLLAGGAECRTCPCRTAALGGHVARCENAACGHTLIAYNSCRNRHCQKCQGAASRRWLADREADLLPVSYFHVVYTLPSELRDIAYQNKRVVYDLLMKAAAETTIAIAADPKRLARGSASRPCSTPGARH